MSALGEAGVVRADARSLPLPDACVDLIVTSPPYWALRDYRDGESSLAGQIGAEATPQEYVKALLECTREWMRVLKPEGSIFVNLGDVYGRGTRSREDRAQALHDRRAGGKARGLLGDRLPSGTRAKSLLGLPWRYALGCADELDLVIRAEIIWSKPNGLPESVTDRVRRSHEHWFHLVQQPKYFSAVDEIRTPQSSAAHHLRYANSPNSSRINTDRGDRGDVARRLNPIGALPGSVWDVATQPLAVPDHLGIDHFAAFPATLPLRIIAGWSPEGGLIVDPFGGTGTTALAARALGRRAISFDRIHENALHWYRGQWGSIYHIPPRERWHGKNNGSRDRGGSKGYHLGEAGNRDYEDDGMRLPRSIIPVANLHKRCIHPTEKPVGILTPLIEYGCPPGGLVLDPFAGSASTLVAARETGRRAIGIEAHEPYAERAALRLAQAPLEIA